MLQNYMHSRALYLEVFGIWEYNFSVKLQWKPAICNFSLKRESWTTFAIFADKNTNSNQANKMGLLLKSSGFELRHSNASLFLLLVNIAKIISSISCWDWFLILGWRSETIPHLQQMAFIIQIDIILDANG